MHSFSELSSSSKMGYLTIVRILLHLTAIKINVSPNKRLDSLFVIPT